MSRFFAQTSSSESETESENEQIEQKPSKSVAPKYFIKKNEIFINSNK